MRLLRRHGRLLGRRRQHFGEHFAALGRQHRRDRVRHSVKAVAERLLSVFAEPRDHVLVGVAARVVDVLLAVDLGVERVGVAAPIEREEGHSRDPLAHRDQIVADHADVGIVVGLTVDHRRRDRVRIARHRLERAAADRVRRRIECVVEVGLDLGGIDVVVRPSAQAVEIDDELRRLVLGQHLLDALVAELRTPDKRERQVVLRLALRQHVRDRDCRRYRSRAAVRPLSAELGLRDLSRREVDVRGGDPHAVVICRDDPYLAFALACRRLCPHSVEAVFELVAVINVGEAELLYAAEISHRIHLGSDVFVQKDVVVLRISARAACRQDVVIAAALRRLRLAARGAVGMLFADLPRHRHDVVSRVEFNLFDREPRCVAAPLAPRERGAQNNDNKHGYENFQHFLLHAAPHTNSAGMHSHTASAEIIYHALPLPA